MPLSPEWIRDIRGERELHIHLIGIGGVGMAGLAHLLLARGHRISGSEQNPNALCDWLTMQDAAIFQNHQTTNLSSDCDLVIRSSAIPTDNPEWVEAAARTIPVHLRGEILPLLLDQSVSIAVCGTHGKTTTTAMIAHILRRADRNPGWFVGGESRQLGAVAESGGGEVMVAECDESDGTLVHYHPSIGLVTNIEFDHMETFGSAEAFHDCFQRFANQCERRIFCAEDAAATQLMGAAGDLPTLSYGFTAGDLRGLNLRCEGDRSRFDLDTGKGRLACELNVPGRYNALNALGALTACRDAGIPLINAAAALASFQAVDRRFQTVWNRNGIRVIEDYAHHPTEIRVLVQAARQLDPQRIFAVFQPHRFSRTLALGPEFPAAFQGVDDVLLVPVYAASEQPLKGGTSEDLLAHFQVEGVTAHCLPDLETAWETVRDQLREGDLLLLVGAGDVNRISKWASQL